MQHTSAIASVVLAVATLLCTQAQAQLVLVTEQEALASQAAPEPMVARALPAPDAPRINVMAPSLGNPVQSPTAIQLKFAPTAPAVILPETFKVKYGALRIDITGRLKGAAKVTAEGIDVAQASLPKGSHKLYIEIQDSIGRLGERLIQFSVE